MRAGGSLRVFVRTPAFLTQQPAFPLLLSVRLARVSPTVPSNSPPANKKQSLGTPPCQAPPRLEEGGGGFCPHHLRDKTAPTCPDLPRPGGWLAGTWPSPFHCPLDRLLLGHGTEGPLVTGRRCASQLGLGSSAPFHGARGDVM